MGGGIRLECPKCHSTEISIDKNHDVANAIGERDNISIGNIRSSLRDLREQNFDSLSHKLFDDIRLGRLEIGKLTRDHLEKDLSTLDEQVTFFCRHCRNSWVESVRLYSLADLTYRLKSYRNQIADSAMTHLIGLDCAPLRNFYQERDWKDLEREIFSEHNPDLLSELYVIDLVIKVCSPTPRLGGGGFETITMLLYAIGVGIVSDFIYDLIKARSKTIRNILDEEQTKQIARKKANNYKKKIESLSFEMDDGIPRNLVPLLKTMPQDIRNRIIDELALQHALRTRDKLKKLMRNVHDE